MGGEFVNFTAGGTGEPSEVQTEPAEVIPGGARLKGELNPGGLATTYYFEYIGDNAVECLGVENCWPIRPAWDRSWVIPSNRFRQSK